MITAAQAEQVRAAQEALMLSTGTITRGGNRYEYIDGQEVLTPAPEVYSGKLRIQRKPNAPMWATAGAEQVPNPAYIGALPWTVTGLDVRDVLTVTASDDPDLVGRRFLITEIEANGFIITARRFHCELLND